MRLHLMPREEQFFDIFDEAAANVVKGAKVLREMVQDFSLAEQKAAECVTIEHEGDRLLHEVFRRLNDTFITPLDREDIHALIGGLDDILDYIESTCDRLVLYKVEAPTGEAVEMADVIVRATEQIEIAVGALKNVRSIEKILDPCIVVNDLENEGDRINRRALQRLFGGEIEPLEALKWREIYDHFEQAIDHCEDVAHTLQAVVVKNA